LEILDENIIDFSKISILDQKAIKTGSTNLMRKVHTLVSGEPGGTL
jgi:hypothetical protein